MSDPVREAAIRGDAAFLAGWLSARQMLSIPTEVVARWIPKMHLWLRGGKPEGHPFRNVSGGTIDLWMRVRLSEENLYPVGRTQPLIGRLSVELHVGFLSITETPEELARLWKGDKTIEEDLKKLRTNTPAIERTPELIQPIDSTAARVTFNLPIEGVPEREEETF